MQKIDLRSDTVTKPTPAMREAMAQAEVGDDVYGEDPTVNRLEALAAEMLGKEAAVFVPSGVMGNQLALRLHTRPGDEVIVDSTSHLIRYEGGSASSLSGVQLVCVPGHRGRLSPESVEAAIRPKGLHNPPTTLVCLEQTHNVGGGSIYSLEVIHQIAEVARTHGLALHLDGARLFNAVVSTGVAAADYARPFDTVSFCLSKGLGAPVGSMVVSDAARVQTLRRLRKVFGGGMRQVGILAAAGVYALEHHIVRLAEDHVNAHYLATLLEDIPGVVVDVKAVETNMVMFQVPHSSKTTDKLLADCREAGVLLNAMGDRAFRVVTHLDVNHEDMVAAGRVFRQVFSAAG
ncbi:low-specificity L-threonine aldolase [Candidatus Nitrospira allomarina]|uniref:Low-specificity L-threonine aldolase n=1 Tax=Candidatus Nitrospira allomarina TaxID=3020900 RepID=A0AA96JU81_9BACT|nr:low-specificity L-threonine aldolase [Candidatus Nitrospira allomarina]WNM59850.1 low-specificity L-threonine aldolase [Candidatus Nitrospira allomarina]